MAELGHVTVTWREARTSALVLGVTSHRDICLKPWALQGTRGWGINLEFFSLGRRGHGWKGKRSAESGSVRSHRMDLRTPASLSSGFHFSLIRCWDLGKSCSCLEELIDLHSTKPWTQPRDKNCTPGSG